MDMKIIEETTLKRLLILVPITMPCSGKSYIKRYFEELLQRNVIQTYRTISSDGIRK